MSEEKLRNRDFLRSIQRIGTWLPYHSYQANHTVWFIRTVRYSRRFVTRVVFLRMILDNHGKDIKISVWVWIIRMINTAYFLIDGYIEPISDLHLKEARSNYYQVNRKSVFVAIGVCVCVLILVIVFVTLGCIYSGISKPSDNVLIFIPMWCINMIHIRFLAAFCE